MADIIFGWFVQSCFLYGELIMIIMMNIFLLDQSWLFVFSLFIEWLLRFFLLLGMLDRFSVSSTELQNFIIFQTFDSRDFAQAKQRAPLARITIYESSNWNRKKLRRIHYKKIWLQFPDVCEPHEELVALGTYTLINGGRLYTAIHLQAETLNTKSKLDFYDEMKWFFLPQPIKQKRLQSLRGVEE